VSDRAAEIDPDNRWLSHANVRRLDAEAIRDSLFAVSGQLDRKMFGPGFAANSNTPRRSVYVMSRRNSLDQFLQVFDSPLPFATTGRRDITNVPAQSLTMLNDPLVMELAGRWIDRLGKQDANATPEKRVSIMYRTALGREPTADERDALLQYLGQTLQEFSAEVEPEHDERAAWTRVAHALLNLKEFIYIR
jgi:hypothetical protein